MTRRVVFTDLDGTLLDPVTYRFDSAAPALEMIRKRNIPLVLCSSKTRAEIAFLRAKMGNGHPFISENGGGIYIPEGYFSFDFESESFEGYRRIVLGKPHAFVRRCFEDLRKRLGIRVRGFSDMNDEEVAMLTGISREEAKLARQRDFDEPFVFEESPDERFLKAIEEAGLNWTKGRLFHVMGNHDKGLAVNRLKSFYEREYGPISSIGLGDSLNDLPMLRAVDFPVFVRNGENAGEIALEGLMRTRQCGPAGWNEAVLKLIK